MSDEIVRAIEPIVDELVALEQRLNNIQLEKGDKGDTGVSPSADEVAKALFQSFGHELKGEKGDAAEEVEVEIDAVASALKADEEFIALTKGKDAEEVEAVAAHLAEAHADALKGDPGKDAEVDYAFISEYLKSTSDFKGEPGKDADPVDTSLIAKEVVTDPDFIRQVVKTVDKSPWDEGIYREGSFVSHFAGRTYKALVDTTEQPGDSAHWERVGTDGFRDIGGYPGEEHKFEPGDWYHKDGATFFFDGVSHRMITPKSITEKQFKKETASLKNHFKHLINAFTEKQEAAVLRIDSLSVITEEHEKLFNLLGDYIDAEENEDTPIVRFLGDYDFNGSYKRGDVVRYRSQLWVCHRGGKPADKIFDYFKLMMSAGGTSNGGALPAVASPFNVIADRSVLPAAGAGHGDTYYAVAERSLHIWDGVNNTWTSPVALVGSFATDALAKANAGIAGEVRWAQDSNTLWVWDDDAGGSWVKSSSGIAHVADAAARAAYTPTTQGEVVIQDDTAELWHYVSVPGGARRWLPIMPSPADNSMLRALVWDPVDPNIIHWRDERDALLTVVDNAAMFAIPIPHLQTGKLVYNQSSGKLYEFIASPTTLTRSIADWKEAGGGGGGAAQVYNRVADLPQNTAAGTPMPPYSMGYVRFHADATTPLGEIFIAVPGAVPPAVNWQQIASSVFKKATQAGADVPDPQPKDIQITTEAGHKEVKLFDGATNAWITIYSEDQIQSWIAAGNLFTGTAEETGHGTAGAIDVANMPAESALGATDKGHYWVWVGTSGHVIAANEIGGAASAIDGQALSVGDWIQVSEPTTGNYQYSVIPGDLLSKATADSLFGLNTWVQGAAQIGTLVSHNGSIYKAGAAILATDLAPDDATNTKWVKVNITAGVHNVPADNNLPPTAPSGEVYLVVNSARNNGAPAFYIYDTPSAQWLNIGGGGGGGGGATGQPMNLMGGELLYNTGTPIGSITMWPVDIPPDGWLICNGNAFDGVRYPILMQILGGDNHTPDLQNQFIRGASGALDNFAKHQWTTGLPRNPLTTSNSGTHQHDYWDTLDSSGQGIKHAARGSNESYIAPTRNPTWPDGDHSHTIGGGDAETAPDHVLLHYIIKAEDMGLEKRII